MRKKLIDFVSKALPICFGLLILLMFKKQNRMCEISWLILFSNHFDTLYYAIDHITLKIKLAIVKMNSK